MFISFETPRARYIIKMTNIDAVKYIEGDTEIVITWSDGKITNYNFLNASAASQCYDKILKQMGGEIF